MERSEPTLVPEWLRSTGNVNGAGKLAQHSVSSSSHSEVLSSVHLKRNRCLRSVSDKDTPRSAFPDRTSSSSSRLSSNSNGSPKHPYSSFTRTHRDKNRDKGKERSVVGDFWDHEDSDPLGDILLSRAEKDSLRRSRSLVYRKPVDVLLQRPVESKNSSINNHDSSNSVPNRGIPVRSIQKTVFEKDFPSLGQGMSDVGRVSSPGLSTAVQCLPISNPGLIGGEGWTSALAEVPTTIGGNSMVATCVPQSALANSSSGVSSPTAGLNMAEALSQGPSRARTTSQVPDKTQRLEELAIKQSRQLIPVTPSMPKGLVLGSDKSKPKTVVRTSEMNVAAKSVQQQPASSQLANQSLRGGQIRSDTSRSYPAGKFLVLKPVWENGVSSMTKDLSSPTNNASRVGSSQLTGASVAPSTPSKHPNNSSKISTVEHKVAALTLNSESTVEKRSSMSQAQSRSDFFNLVRKKTSMNTSSVLQDSGVVLESSTVEKSCEVFKGASAAVTAHVAENGGEVTSNGDTHEREKSLCLKESIYPDEEEAAFLRSLGWEENAGEDDGLTEEEINAFYEEYMKLRPSLKLCRGVQPKIPLLSESHITGSSGASSELSLSGSEGEV